MQAGKFHLLDMSLTIPPVLLPIFGFRSATAPELTINTRNIKEGNYEYPRKVVESAEVADITLEQGVQLANSDFYDWVRKCVTGRIPPKTLLLVQFTRINPRGASPLVFPSGPNPLARQAVGGNFEFAMRLPGRAWILHESRAVRYKAASDFDGMAQDVSLASLDIRFEEFTELNMGV